MKTLRLFFVVFPIHSAAPVGAVSPGPKNSMTGAEGHSGTIESRPLGAFALKRNEDAGAVHVRRVK